MNLIKSCCLFVVFSSFLACTSQVSDVKSVSYTEFVNPFIGTDFTGNTYPGAQAPFGMVQLSPQQRTAGLGPYFRIFLSGQYHCRLQPYPSLRNRRW